MSGSTAAHYRKPARQPSMFDSRQRASYD